MSSNTHPGTSSPAPADKPRKIDWPQPVRKYVQRAFMPEHNIPGIGRSEMEQKLKQTITEANSMNELLTVDWDRLPLPQQMIQEERSRIKHGPSGLQQPRSFGGDLTIRDRSRTSDEISSPRKRKSAELHGSSGGDEGTPRPWRKDQERGDESTATVVVGSRLGSYLPSTSSASKLSDGHHAKRARGHHEASAAASASGLAPSPSRPDVAIPLGPIVGRSQELEKRYFRLTAPPDPDTVRPLPVLRQTLDLLRRKWKEDNNYAYICDQFKSLRQDLTVQHIRNDFTVHVYENHARIALEKGDLGEYNQCQTQLGALYGHTTAGHPFEFKAYRILYLIHTCNRTDMNDVLAGLGPAERRDPAVVHALEVRSALASSNHHRFFRLYLDTPNMGAYLMDMFVERERLAALAQICRA